MARSVNVTRPVASLVAVVEPPSVPSPLESCAVTVTPSRATSLPSASWSWSTGCGLRGTPASATAGGATASASLAATPVARNTAASGAPSMPRSSAVVT